MATLGIMKQRIADEIARADLTSQIAYAISDAIKHHERARFYFNEAINTFTTVDGQEWYSSSDASWIPDVIEIDSLRVTVSGRPWPLMKATMADMEFLAAGTATEGDPERFCYYRQQIRLYPTPNAARTMTCAYVQRLAELTDDSQENAWTDDAEELIRARAKIILWEQVIRGQAGAANGAQLRVIEADALRRLRNETASRISSRQISADYL